jgi:vacuolar-type H+-ATPase subunit E/Vma4
MPASEFVAKVGAVAGLNLDTDSPASEIAAALRKEGRTVSVRVQPHSIPVRGVLVESSDGKLRWDNTFEGRLRRLRPTLRRLCVPIVFEET